MSQLIREGEQATFKGRSIKSINVSDWAKPWIALYSSENAALILEPILPSDPVNVELTIISDDDTSASISNIELRHIKFGSDVKQLSNEHQNTSLHFTLTLHTVERSLTFTAHLNNLGDNAYEAREVMKFLEALAIGGVLRICFLNHNNNVIEIPIDPQIDKISDPEGIKVIEQVCKIQDKMRRFIRIPNDEWPIEDIRGIGRLSRIVQFGSLKGRAEDFTINFPRMNLQIVLDGYSAGNRILFRINYPECVIEIFNNKIDAGSIIRYLTCAPKLNVDDIRELINSTNDDELQIEFTDVDVVDIFPERFLHEASMLARKLIRQYRGARIYYYSFIVWDAFAQINNSIELAVQGLTMTDIIEARKILASETSFPFNIVDIDDTPSDLREHILTKGRII